MQYRIPAQAHIGHVHLKVADLEKALSFYIDILGFEVMQRYGYRQCLFQPGVIITISA